MRPLLALLVLALPGCGPDVPTGALVDRPRLLGARVHVEGDPSRAWPRPGEDVRVEWVVASPSADARWSSLLQVCVHAPTNVGVPGCAGEPFAFIASGEPSANPGFALTIPDAAFLGAAEELLALGVLCAGGEPVVPVEGALPSCRGAGATAEVVILRIPLAGEGGEVNQHPTIPADATSLDGRPWETPPLEAASGQIACPAESSPGLPVVEWRGPDEPSVLRVETDAADREEHDRLVLGAEPRWERVREELMITHVATAGSLPRPRTLVFDGAPSAAEVRWRHPPLDEVPATGLGVRFWLVSRDGRGGLDWAVRALCVRPPG